MLIAEGALLAAKAGGIADQLGARSYGMAAFSDTSQSSNVAVMDTLASTLDTDLAWIRMHMRPSTAHCPGSGGVMAPACR
jgi:hypothetical protein